MQGEMIELPGNRYGLALNLERDSVGAIVMGPYADLAEGQKSNGYRSYSGSAGWSWSAGPCRNTLGQPLMVKGPIENDGFLAGRSDCPRRYRA